ncbi:MAG: hypothetical protein AB7J34_19510 [Limisphaerales bacterium]
MQTMTHRRSFALDQATAGRLKRLALLWQVSQAEVVRRAIAQAENSSIGKIPDPIRMLQELHASGKGLEPRTARAFLADVRADRKRWRNKRSASLRTP